MTETKFDARQKAGAVTLQSVGVSEPSVGAVDRTPSNSPLAAVPWLLLGILAVQAWLSLRLMWGDTAFQDEALYLWAGRLEWAHLLHDAPVPGFPYYFSGAPFLYPPLAAIASAIGGLTGARLLSLAFMLAATAFLYLTAQRLYGTTAGAVGAALFAVLGPVAHVGSFATYDAMSLGLLSCAAWCAAQGFGRSDATAWTIGAGVSLVFANLTAYSTAIFDPVVIAIAILAGFPDVNWREARGRGFKVLLYAASVVAVVAVVGGTSFLRGFYHVILDRAVGIAPAGLVFSQSWMWTGAAIVTAGLGLTVSLAVDRVPGRRLLAVVLAASALLVPLEQAHVHTTTSLSKHVAFGVWFAAVIAGYGVGRIIVMVRPVWLRVVPVLAVLASLSAAASAGAAQAQVLGTDWPDAAAFIAAFRPIASHTPGRFLVEVPTVPEYYLPQGTQWQRWESTYGITGLGVVSPGYYERLLREGQFSLVALDFRSTPPLDKILAAFLDSDKRFKVIARLAYGSGYHYTVWRYQGGSR